MILIGLTGAIGHGKTTLAELLAEQAARPCHFETWELVAEVASAWRSVATIPSDSTPAALTAWLAPLAAIVPQIVHCDLPIEALVVTADKLHDQPEYYEKLLVYQQASAELAQTPINADTKELFRPLLQWLGGFFVAVCDDGVWYDELLRRIADAQSGGADLVTVGGVRYPGDAEHLRKASALIINVVRPDMEAADSQDITERQRTLIIPDTTVLNNGSLTDLQACAARIYQDCLHNRLQPEYSAVINHTK